MNLETRAATCKAVYVFLNDMGRKAESRNSPNHHTAKAIRHFVDMNAVTGNAKIVGGGQAGGPTADDSD